jgi:hypothetical protein
LSNRTRLLRTSASSSTTKTVFSGPFILGSRGTHLLKLASRNITWPCHRSGFQTVGGMKSGLTTIF